MSRSLIQQSFNEEDDWEDPYNRRATPSTPSTFAHYNTIFSDDEDDQHQGSFSRWFTQQNNDPSYVDPVLSSSTYHIHQADNALVTLKHVVNEKDGWKKALKHKSGVMVHMKNGLHKGDKTPIFKGEAIIQGFTPQSIFYVIGMRKLWDEQYEDGNLVENLNDTTSLTYEVMKPTATSKSRDLSLVEKIECTQNGAIVFACTSVETPRIPRRSGKTRVNIKLQGWILEPLHGSPQPATRVTFVIQENMKGWVPAFAKKSLARRPLVISKVAEYLEKKTERMKQQQQQKKLQSTSFLSIHHGFSRRPSVMTNHSPQPQQRSLHSDTQHSILVNPEPPKVQAKKHILFADHDDSSVSTATESRAKYRTPKPKSSHLYLSHRHPIQKVESIQLLKKLTFSLDNWNTTQELDDGITKFYQFSDSFHFSDDEEDPFMQQQPQKRKIPFVRADSVIEGWTAEQLCSVVQCFGSRKIWDILFEEGRMIDRFSQKEYLVRWFLSGKIDLSAITSIETDPISGAVYTATTSVNDPQVPPDSQRIRAHTDLYGWVFKPTFDKQGRTLSVHVKFICNMDFKYSVPDGWINTCLHSIQHLHHYLTQYGCPPYIRRVAGKVVREDFDAIANKYQIVFIAKHQPSSSYRARKQNQTSSWCTDIRFHQTMFPYGVDIRVEPPQRVQVSFSQKSIKVFTIDESMDGQQLILTLLPLSEHQHGSATYKYNGEWCHNNNVKEKVEPVQHGEAPSTLITDLPTHIEKRGEMSMEIENNDKQPKEGITKVVSVPLQEEEVKEEPLLGKEVKKEPLLEKEVKKEPLLEKEVKEEPLLGKEVKKEPLPEKEVKKEPLKELEAVLVQDVKEEEEEEEKKEEEGIKVPEGYLLVPEYQHTNIIMITDELSFNSQQVSVIFIAMVICYYMGKFTSCNC